VKACTSCIGIFCAIFLAMAYWAVLWLMGRREDVLHGEFVESGPPAEESVRPVFPERPVRSTPPERPVEAAPAAEHDQAGPQSTGAEIAAPA